MSTRTILPLACCHNAELAQRPICQPSVYSHAFRNLNGEQQTTFATF